MRFELRGAFSLKSALSTICTAKIRTKSLFAGLFANQFCGLDIRTVSWAYLPNNILKQVIQRLRQQPKNLIIKDASPTALDDGTLLDCFASLAKTDNTTAGQGETDCRLGIPAQQYTGLLRFARNDGTLGLG